MGRWPLSWGAPTLAFAVTFLIVTACGSDVAITDDDAHR